MKKKLKLFTILVLSFFLTGCVKLNYNIGIKWDKSINFEIIQAVNESMLGEDNKGEAMMSEEELQEIRDKGYSVKNYYMDSLTGYVFTKKIKNIDNVSTTTGNNEFDLSTLNDFTEENSEALSKMFYVKKGFFKNTYTANFTSSSTSDLEDNFNTGSYEEDNTTEYEYDDSEDDLFSSDDSSSGSLGDMSEEEMMQALSSLDIKFSVTLPFKVINTNATSVSENGKELTWNLVELQTNNISFEFELYNWGNILMVVGGVILLIVIVIIILKSIKPKSNNTGNYYGGFVAQNNVPQNQPVQTNMMNNGMDLNNNFTNNNMNQGHTSFIMNQPQEQSINNQIQDFNSNVNLITMPSPIDVTPIQPIQTVESSQQMMNNMNVVNQPIEQVTPFINTPLMQGPVATNPVVEPVQPVANNMNVINQPVEQVTPFINTPPMQEPVATNPIVEPVQQPVMNNMNVINQPTEQAAPSFINTPPMQEQVPISPIVEPVQQPVMNNMNVINQPIEQATAPSFINTPPMQEQIPASPIVEPTQQINTIPNNNFDPFNNNQN